MVFGESPVTLEQLAKELRVRIPQLASALTNKEYTRAAKQALTQIGDSLNLRTYCTNRQRGTKEFLLDLVWWKDAPDEQRAVLAVESEWGNPRDQGIGSRADQVTEDFKKLLAFKAPMKLMLFSADNQEMRDAIHAEIQRYLRRFAQHVKGEEYLFMEFAESNCYSYTWTPNQDGRCVNTRLEPLDDASAKVVSAHAQGAAAGADDVQLVVPQSRFKSPLLQRKDRPK